MRWETIHPDGESYDGVVMDVKADFVTIAQESDFEFDGLIVLPRRSLEGYRDGPTDACCNEILRAHNAFATIHYPAWMQRCQSLAELFSGLKARDIWPGVEILVDNDTDDEFYLGQLTEVGREEFRLMCYDSEGNWEREFSLRYDQLFRVEINSRYCKRFNAYMKSKASEE